VPIRGITLCCHLAFPCLIFQSHFKMHEQNNIIPLILTPRLYSDIHYNICSFVSCSNSMGVAIYPVHWTVLDLIMAVSVVKWLACWPLVPKFAGSNPAEAVGFFGRESPQHAFLRRGSKAVSPMSQLCGM
jgi:hypothetical protein